MKSEIRWHSSQAIHTEIDYTYLGACNIVNSSDAPVLNAKILLDHPYCKN